MLGGVTMSLMKWSVPLEKSYLSFDFLLILSSVDRGKLSITLSNHPSLIMAWVLGWVKTSLHHHIQVFDILCFSFKNIYYILDNDCCFTFSGSFSNTCDPKGNSFVFPEFKAKIAFEKQLSLFMFNPTFIHCAEKGVFDEGETSYLFRNSSLIKNYHNPKIFFLMTLIQINCWPYTPNNWFQITFSSYDLLKVFKKFLIEIIIYIFLNLSWKDFPFSFDFYLTSELIVAYILNC